MTRMKESGIDWIGQIPEEWELGRVKDFYKFFTGFTPDTSRVEYYGDINDFVWVTIADMTSKKIESSKQTLSDIFIKEKRPQVSRLGSLLYSFKLSVGKVAFANTDLYTNEAIATFEDGPNINLRFLYYSSYLIEFNSETNIYGAKLLNSDRIRNACIVQPSLSEQTKIADFLDKKTAQLDKAKALLEEQIQKLKDYRASLIYETVTKGLDKTVPLKDSGIDWIGQVPKGWVVKRLKYLVNKIGSGKTPLGGSEIFEETGILFIRSQNIHNGLIQLEDKSTYINRNIHRQMIGTSVEKNGILLNITGASIGRVAKYDLDVEANVNQHVCIIRCDRFVLPDYLMYFIMSEFGQFMIKIHQISGNREGLSFDNIGNFKIIIPDLDYQYKISQYLNKKMLIINQMIKTKEQQIENINKQRQTLIYDYVTGKRRV
ncbi:restriction endonuclease subunit S [Streptococcus parasanguinis]|uniref:restriction endonuclease subunit S n=1 Tax=Streptococcus parasanguinis TaxID=1318 RepID=UPI0019137470|nr:restriction endonuclease subunit S [Streptococcus parasanguinis]MBK5127221.1 restriction endonuclease subunit S [Streptococcus parasanguinis]